MKSYDKRFCMFATLQILREEREKICNDSLQYEPMIYNGLHEFKSDYLRKTFFQAYIVDWLDSHWENVKLKFNKHSEYSSDEKKRMMIYFSDYFSKLLDDCRMDSIISTLIIPYILEEESQILAKLIECEAEWQKSLDKLNVCRKKHKEKFQQIIDEIKFKTEE